MTLWPGIVNIFNMNTLEKSLNKIAETILHLDEASLTSLWDKYKHQVEHFSHSAEWEKAVIIFSIINGVRVKNSVFNENLLKKSSSKKPESPPEAPKAKPYLRLVK